MTDSDHSKKRVTYYYDPDIATFRYESGHCMKPRRIEAAHHLILNYGICSRMEIARPTLASYEDLIHFHSEEYVDFLKKVNLNNIEQFGKYAKKFHVTPSNGGDCPAFDGLYKFCQLSCGGSLAAAVKLNKKKADIVINWMGGLHHAKKSNASGFCYTNDIVLGILELLKHHRRVLYIDIDAHHGDGVEEAFYCTDRVMTVSFHQYGNNFFPGTGSIGEVGAGRGRLYSVNVPLRKNICDFNYQQIFERVIDKVMQVYQPEAVVLQCGADSLIGDHLGNFNLTLKGHGNCVSFLRKYDVPLMLLGGGGYTPTNVARCWTYETALAVGVDLPNQLPYTDYYEYFTPDCQLHIEASPIMDENSQEYLMDVCNKIIDNLNQIKGPPGVQMQQVPQDAMMVDNTYDIDFSDPNVRLPNVISDQLVEDIGELYANEKEGGDLRNEQLYE